MRRKDHVQPFQPGMDKWFLFKNVQPRPGNFLRFQGMYQCRFIHDGPARGIDQECRRLHAKQFGRVKHLPGFAIERHVQGDKIGFSKQRVQIAIFRVQLLLDVFGRAGPAVVSHFHCKSGRAPRNSSTDAAESNDSQRLAPDIGSAKLIEIPTLPASGAHVLVGFHQPAGHGHHESPGKIRGGFIQHAGSVGNRDAAFGASRNINVVVADGNVRHDAKLRRGAQHVVSDTLRQQTHQAVFVFQAAEKLVA